MSIVAPVTPVPVSLAMKLEEPVRWLRKMAAFAQEELHSPVRLSLASTWRAWRLGFTRRTYSYYGLDRNNPADYLSDYQQNVRTRRINGANGELIYSKLGFHLLMEWCGGPCPRLFGVVNRGVVMPVQGGRVTDVRRWLEERLDAEGRLVIKPVHAFKGRGFIVLQQDGTDWTLNGNPMGREDVTALVRSIPNSIVTSYARQAAYAQAIFPRTANTVRMLTLWDFDMQAPFVAAVAHRFGTPRSEPVDNWRYGMGGLSVAVDAQSGLLGRGVTFEDGRLVWYEKHPDTQAPIAGVQVARWGEVRDAILALARRLPFLPDLAWDLIVTETGFEVLELNGGSGMPVYQVHGPLLADPRTRRFYESYGVVPARKVQASAGCR